MRTILITDKNCLLSQLAINWAKDKSVEIVNASECPSVIGLYGVGKFPTLLSIGDYGVVAGRVDGFNVDLFDGLYTN